MQIAKRVHTHLLVEDPYSAIFEATNHLKIHPDSKVLGLALIKALCLAGKEVEALEKWKELLKSHEEILGDRSALETLAWGVLNKGESSNQLMIKFNALLGASMTRDAKAIPLILEALRGSNSLLRALAAQMAAAYGDFPLQAEITRLLREEKIWHVRLELIKAVGALRMTFMKDDLKKILENPQALAEEKAAAIVSLVTMYDTIEEKELLALIKSNRAGLRELACQIVIHLGLKDKVEFLTPLLNDSHPQVRVSVLNALALLGVKSLKETPLMQVPTIEKLLYDQSIPVAITASWLALLQGDQRGSILLRKWVLQAEPEWARLASGALTISGEKGIVLLQELLSLNPDPYVQVNLALGLIGQRTSVALATEVINKHLSNEERWMWESSLNPLFRSLSPSKVRYNPQIPNYPSIVDQLTRLELLSVLCIMQYPRAQEAVKLFLQKQTWGVAGAAAVTLLQEGDNAALEVVRALLKDPEEKIRIQAALILALLGGDKAAVEVLKTAYPHADREIKIHILEALAKVGDPGTIPFLLERLNQPFQVLRVVAATAIIQCLYH